MLLHDLRIYAFRRPCLCVCIEMLEAERDSFFIGSTLRSVTRIRLYVFFFCSGI